MAFIFPVCLTCGPLHKSIRGPQLTRVMKNILTALKRPHNSQLQLWIKQFKPHFCVFLRNYLPVDSGRGCSNLLIQNATLEFIVLGNKKRQWLGYNSSKTEENDWFALCCVLILLLLKRKVCVWLKKKKKSALTLNIFNSVSLVTSSLSNGCFSFTTVLHKVSRSPNSVLDTPLEIRSMPRKQCHSL